jgi:hypothetical protein
VNGNRIPVIGAIVALSALVTAAVLFVGTDDAAVQRLGILVAFLAPTSVGLMALLRSDQAARSTDSGSRLLRTLDGGFDKRIKAAVRDVRDEPESSETPPGDRGGPDPAEPHVPLEPHE